MTEQATETRKYEAVIILDTKAKEESVETLISRIGKEIEDLGARLEQIEQLGRRKLIYTPRHVDEGHYVSFQFHASPELVDRIQARLKLNDDVFLQQYHRA